MYAICRVTAIQKIIKLHLSWRSPQVRDRQLSQLHQVLFLVVLTMRGEKGYLCTTWGAEYAQTLEIPHFSHQIAAEMVVNFDDN